MREKERDRDRQKDRERDRERQRDEMVRKYCPSAAKLSGCCSSPVEGVGCREKQRES